MNKIISLSNASIQQGNKIILSDINLEIHQADFFYMVGKTGSGKSSLIKALYADLPFYKGQCDVLGFDMNKIKPSQIPLLRRQIGVIFQDFQLLTDRNIYDNLEFVLKCTGWKNKQKIIERIKEVLEMVDMQNSMLKNPFELSGGEQQRVVIARALLNEPQLIIADEPTGNLDPKTSEQILQILHQINQKGKAIIMVTHDYNMIKKFPKQIIKCQATDVLYPLQKP